MDYTPHQFIPVYSPWIYATWYIMICLFIGIKEIFVVCYWNFDVISEYLRGQIFKDSISYCVVLSCNDHAHQGFVTRPSCIRRISGNSWRIIHISVCAQTAHSVAVAILKDGYSNWPRITSNAAAALNSQL